jgi:hypothetical protein
MARARFPHGGWLPAGPIREPLEALLVEGAGRIAGDEDGVTEGGHSSSFGSICGRRVDPDRVGRSAQIHD